MRMILIYIYLYLHVHLTCWNWMTEHLSLSCSNSPSGVALFLLDLGVTLKVFQLGISEMRWKERSDKRGSEIIQITKPLTAFAFYEGIGCNEKNIALFKLPALGSSWNWFSGSATSGVWIKFKVELSLYVLSCRCALYMLTTTNHSSINDKGIRFFCFRSTFSAMYRIIVLDALQLANCSACANSKVRLQRWDFKGFLKVLSAT